MESVLCTSPESDSWSLVQGNCHRCLVPKRLLDDLDQNFAARTKENMFEAINDAIFKGVYPGWLADRQKEILEKDPDLDVDRMSIHPKPLLKEDGTLVKARAATAAARLGRHLVVGFFDDLEGLDPHNMVHDPVQGCCF
jgi:hypothetical protein